ncbi:MAG: hypothetical protein PWP23_2564 [Candidatus Sumerlaeota bacterium]|nr:hypothetical protein [Candidatus Sumerlaeota bacterium]
MFAQVALNLPLAQPYTYAVPEGLRSRVAPGVLVSVPFGKRAQIGCVVALSDDAGGVAEERIRSIEDVVSPEYRIGPELLALARFVSDYYFASPGEALASVSVVGFRDVKSQRAEFLRLVDDWRERSTGSLTPKQRAACERLEEAGFPVEPRQNLAKAAGAGPSIIKKLLDLGLLEVHDPPALEEQPASLDFAPHLMPTAEQQSALDAVLAAVAKPEFRVFLLHGVTGSGKTEIYLQAIAEALHLGKTALCLLPEISLTPQTVARFQERFRQEIGVFHSQLTRRQKLELHRRIQSGAVRVVIGARSAVFSPLPKLGVLILDEEHDGSYKQNETPRYHARDVGIVRAQRLGIPVVLGSATPSLESWHNAMGGKYELLRLSTRAAGIELPSVRTVDLAAEVQDQPRPSLFSGELIAAIAQRLEAGEQTLLFLNRRGFSNFLFCPSCKWVAKCDEDDVALTVHRRVRRGQQASDSQADLFAVTTDPKDFILRCHFCGSRRDAPTKCPECDSDGLITVGAGTQRVEEELAAQFPQARLMRLDQDTAGGREKFLAAWERIMSGEADIIFGTQMIAKGLHLEGVSLVGVVLADIGLFIPDFRAEERTFQLLTQVAGRSGRIAKGEVIFQSYMPTHTAIRFAMAHDTEGFMAEELMRRRKLGFPPFTRMAAVTLSDADRDRAYEAARRLAFLLGRLRSSVRPPARITVNGPTVAPLARLAGRFRYRILLRAETHRPVAAVLRAALAHPDWTLPGSTRLTIDVDPLDLL